MIEYSHLPDARSLAIGAGIAAALLAWSYWGSKKRASWLQRLWLILLRLGTVSIVVFCLFNPQRVEEKRHQPRSRLAVLVDTSRSMSINDVPGGRLSQATRWLKEKLPAAVPGSAAVSYYAFDRSLASLSKLDTASPTGTVTALADALESLLALPNDDPLLGVIVCSDGIENSRRDPEAAARVYHRKGIPIHTLAVGTTNSPRDIILENVQARRAVPNEAPTKLTLTVRAPGFENHSVPVRVRQKERIVAVREVKLTGREQQIELEFTPREKGFQTFEVSLPAQPGEWLTSNNRRLFGLDVIDPTIRVLYLEGTPQQPAVSVPEWNYLNDALESDKDIKVKVLVRTTGASGRRLRPGSSDPETGERVYPVEHAKHGFPKTLDELLKYDVVIHSDIRKESFTAEQLENIAHLVEEYGGGFVMIGGASAFGKGGYHQTILDRIIPVAMEQSNDSQTRRIQMQIPSRAWQHPLMALGSTREETQAIWSTKFPALFGCNIVDHAKPGAIVLGQDSTRRNEYGPVLLMAVQQMGRGRSMAFTSDTTRSWGRDFETLWGEPINPAMPLSETNCDSRYYRQFWVNAVRWLAAGKMGKTNTAVTLELAQSYAMPDEKVAASVKVRDAQMREISGADVSVILSAPGKSSLSFKAAYDAAARAYVAHLLPGATADYTVTAVASQKGQRLGQDQQLLVCEERDRESAEVRSNPSLLARLSKLSGGRPFSTLDADLSSISSAFANTPEATVEYMRHPLWDKTWLLTTALALLAIEWTVRRWKGLA